MRQKIKTKMSGLQLWLILPLLFITCISANAEVQNTNPAKTSENIQIDSDQLSHIRDSQLVILQGIDIPELLGQPIANLALFTWQDKKWARIALQIDQASVSDSIHYIKGSKVKIDGDPELIDSRDELVFAAREIGELCPKSPPPDGVSFFFQLFIEDSILDRSGYVYIAIFDSPALSIPTLPLVIYNPELSQYKSRQYEVSFDPDNQLIYRKWIWKPLSDNRNLIDYIKFKTAVTLIGGITLRTGLENIRSKRIAVKNGPIRCISHLKTTIYYGPFPITSVFIEEVFSELGMALSIQISIPTKSNWLLLSASKIVSKMVKKVEMEQGVDFNRDPDETYLYQTFLSKYVMAGRGKATKTINPKETMNDVKFDLSQPWNMVIKRGGGAIFGYMDFNIQENWKGNMDKYGSRDFYNLGDTIDNISKSRISLKATPDLQLSDEADSQIKAIMNMADPQLNALLNISNQSLKLIFIDDAEADDPDGRYPGHLPYVGFIYQVNNISEMVTKISKMMKETKQDVPEKINLVTTYHLNTVSAPLPDGMTLYQIFQEPPYVSMIQEIK